MTHQRLIKQTISATLHSIESKTFAVPNHLLCNVLSLNATASHHPPSKSKTWPIHATAKLESFLPVLCLRRETDAIAANLVYKYLENTDFNTRFWQKNLSANRKFDEDDEDDDYNYEDVNQPAKYENED